MIAWKQIKPKAFRAQAMRLEIAVAINKAAQEVKQDFEKTTATWKHKPEFVMETQVSPPTLLVTTDDEIYGYVDRGTKPHIIWAGAYTGKSSKRALAFPSESTPKTTPRVIGSGPGSRSNTKVVRPYVQHPGTKPRHFEEEIGKKWEKLFKRRMEAAMARAAKASGHSL